MCLCTCEQAANEVQQTWLSAHSQALFSKLKVIEKQLLGLTYTDETMPALRKVDDHLTRAQRQLDARDEQVCCIACACVLYDEAGSRSWSEQCCL